MNLLDFKRDVYSQGGEDGIIEKIVTILPDANKWCVEFGAWNGIYLSNTYNLIKNHGYSAVLVEANKKKFLELKKNINKNQKVVILNELVGFNTNNKLDKLLSTTDIPINFDFLSIDIDGNDFHVWNALSSYKPKVVCIEYNPTIPTEVDFVQAADLKISQGASLLALVRLAKEKEYELIAVTTCNAIFVKKEYFQLFNIVDNTPTKLRKDTSYISYIFSGYDGSIFITGYGKVHWHELLLINRIKKIPKIFRKYPGGYGKLKQFLYYKLYKLFKS